MDYRWNIWYWIEEKIKWLLIPKDPDDNKNVIIELRAGTGGDEACIFVEDVYRMFTMYFKEKKWKCDLINSNLDDANKILKNSLANKYKQRLFCLVILIFFFNLSSACRP